MTRTEEPSRPKTADLRIGDDEIARRFWVFHRSEPAVYRELVWLARRLKRRGYKRGGIGMLWETMRYNRALQTGAEDFKLNNNYRAPYARLIMSREKDLLGFFQLRERG